MTVPPVGGEAVGAVVLFGGFDGDVIQAFELDDVRCMPGDAGVATALGVGGETETKFAACVAQCFEVPDLGLDSGEVGHKFVSFQCSVFREEVVKREGRIVRCGGVAYSRGSGDVDLVRGVMLAIAPGLVAAKLVANKEPFYKVSLRLMDHKRHKARSVGIKILHEMPIKDFALVSDPLTVTLENKDPGYQSYHDVQDTVAPGVEILAKLNIRNGLDLLLDTTLSPGGKWGFKNKMLHYALPLYGGNAKPYIPKFEEHPNISKDKNGAKWQALVKAIEEDKDPQELISLAEDLRINRGE